MWYAVYKLVDIVSSGVMFSSLVTFHRREDDMEFMELLKKWEKSEKSVPVPEII